MHTCSTSHGSGKRELKPQRGTTTHPREWPASGTPTPAVAGGHVEPQELPVPAGGMRTGAATVEGSLAVSYRTQHAPPFLPKWAENVRPHKHLHADVYSSFIHDCLNLVATQMSFSRSVDKLVHPMDY